MDEHILICIFVFLTGACIGSFLNVVALRALSKESIVLPPSKCPKCNTPIKWYDNIPILSYFLTFRGKCRSCGEKVSIQYPIVETLTALIFLAVFLAFGISLKTLLLLIILCTSIVIIITDIKEEAIFDVHSWILIISAIVFSSLDKNISFALIGCIIGAIFMEIVARASYFLVKKEDNEGQEGYEIDKILYYIVTIFTAVSLFIVFLYFGISLRTFLASLLILSAMIISIISVKKEYVISCFAILLLSAVLSLSVLLKNITNYPIVAVTLIATPLVMKLITVFYNYLIKKLGCRINDSEEIPDRESYDNEINEYVKENKRAFGEGDTYIAAASGALLCINFIFAFFLAVLFGTMLIIFKLIKNLLAQKKYVMIFSLLFVIFLSLLIPQVPSNQYFLLELVYMVILLFAIDFIIGMKKTNIKQGYQSICFGPVLLLATFIVLFLFPFIAKYILAV